MFEIIGYGLLRLIGLRRKAKSEVFGSFYEREEGATEFIVGLLACIAAIVAVFAFS